MINILIADDHTLFGNSLKLMLEENYGFIIQDVVNNGEKALQACTNMAVDVILMDINMPGSDGISFTIKIKELYPKIKIIILTSFENIENILNAISSGADGFLLKTAGIEGLVSAIHSVHMGICAFQREVTDLLKAQLCGDFSNNIIKISDSDIELIRLLSNGSTNREIAQKLKYSEGTIKNRITRLMNDLGAKDRTQLVVIALKNNYI